MAACGTVLDGRTATPPFMMPQEEAARQTVDPPAQRQFLEREEQHQAPRFFGDVIQALDDPTR